MSYNHIIFAMIKVSAKQTEGARPMEQVHTHGTGCMVPDRYGQTQVIGPISQYYVSDRICDQLKTGYIEFARIEYFADAIHSAIVNPAG